MWGILPSILILYLVAKTKGADRPKDPPPQITHFLANDLVKPGQVRGRFTLPCQARGKNLKWTWKFNGGPLPPKVKIVNDTLVGGSRDSILNVEQSGRYQCFVEDTKNKVSTFSREIEVKVTVVGRFDDKSKENVKQTVNIGEPFVYNCPSHSPTYGASFSWERIKEGVQLERNERTAISPNGTLFITSITKDFIEFINSSSGIRCKISALNRYFDSGVLTLLDGKQKVPIPRAKWGTKPPKTVVAIEGRGKEMYCIALGDPSPIIVWKKNGKQLGTQKGLETPKAFYNRLLNVTVAEKNSHEDNYTCEAVVDQKTVLKHEFELYVQVIPKWKTEPPASKIDIHIHEKRTIFCDAIADPPPTYSWYRDGTQITTASSKIRAEGNKLHFDEVSLEEDGMYQCVARNSIGMIVSSSWVHILNRTRIVRGPSDLSVNEGTRVDLRCEAVADSSLELHYTWKRDDATIEYNRRVQWLKDQNVLTIADLTVEDAGIYTCVAYTPQPKYSEAKASAIVNIAEAPFPPTNLTLSSDCQNRNTTLSWVTGESNNASILYFLIERKSQYADDFWQVIANVTNPNATSHPLVKLAGNASLAFRIRAVNRIGPSRPSEPTGSFCRTIQAVPEKWPDNFRGVPGKAEELTIAWTAMRRVEWNGPGLYYKLWYRKVNSGDELVEVRCKASNDSFVVPNAGYYVQWEFQIQAINEVGEGPKSPLVKQFSGQDPPTGKPEDITVGTITARSVELSWKPVTFTRGSVDGYRIKFWGESRVSAKRRRRAIPGYASVTNVTGVDTERYTVTGLKPYTNYKFVINAYNSGGNGPESDQVTAYTDEAYAGKRVSTPIYQSAWFIALLVLIALLLLGLLTFVLYTRHQGAKYLVGKREKKRAAAPIDREHFDEEEGSFSNNGRADHPPPYPSQGSLPRGADSDRDSLDDYGEGPQFNEDGSFIEEYGDEKKALPEEKDPSSLATFV
ncbi:PREDICTED: fibronectin type III domain-containing protein-like isoform X2 [Acropora digitifera]|uniref:fibronectin type III domain-containing protein-like isoform X2 n=1 Tax=Acropora digitifera TaxID=70779 RepID=UPI00077ACC4F|nr:PREDICTED: fibronectin type III domain-containing protein-like isoform X2 [Acropora digitifera]